ncbi:hypothetical protein ABK040_010445 [Willaertia magna]
MKKQDTIAYVSQEFTNAIDAAFIEMTEDDEFIDGYRNIGLIFPIPEYIYSYTMTDYPYPDKFDFNYKEKVFTLCYQTNPGSPRGETHELVAKTLVRLLNKRYKINLNYQIKQYDTSKLGFFGTLANAVNSGDCQVCVATTIIDSTRSAQVHFQWPYETSSYGFLRSNLDPEIIVNNVQDLNKTGIIIGTAGGSFYESFLLKQVSAAKAIIVNTGSQGALQLVKEKKVHAVLGDINDLLTWSKNTSNGCTTGCFVKGFGDPVLMASYTTKNILQNNSASNNNDAILSNLTMIVQRMYTARFFIVLIVVIGSLLLNCGSLFIQPTNSQSTNIQYVSSDFIKAIDTAFLEMTDDDEYIDGYRNIGLIFPIPECVENFGITEFPYPDKFDFNYKEKVFTMCYQKNAGSPRQEIHELVAKVLVKLLNRRYKINLNYEVKQLDTSKLGYFGTMKNAVDSGECQVITATTIIDNDRASQIHFQCPFESSSYGFLRSTLDPHIIINTVKDLNRTGITVGISAGTFYESFIPQIKAATIVRSGSGTQALLKLVSQGKVHAVLGDINDLISFQRNFTNNCTACNTRGFGTTVEMASFTTKNIAFSSASSLVVFSSLFLIVTFMWIFF